MLFSGSFTHLVDQENLKTDVSLLMMYDDDSNSTIQSDVVNVHFSMLSLIKHNTFSELNKKHFIQYRTNNPYVIINMYYIYTNI